MPVSLRNRSIHEALSSRRRAADVRIVAALGGNALLHRGERPDAATQIANVARVGARRWHRWPRSTSWSSPTGTGPRWACWPWRARRTRG